MPELASEAQRAVLKDGAVRITAPGHVALITRLKPGFLLVTERGVQTPGTRSLIMREIDAEIAATKPIIVFIDIRGSARVESEGRDAWGTFGKRRRAEITRVHVLVKSKLVEMAFSVMGLFVGSGAIRVVADAEEMLRDIRQIAPQFRALPTITD